MSSYPMGAEYDSNAPWNQREIEPKKVSELIPVWLTDDIQVEVVFNLEILEDNDQDLIINIVGYNYDYFMDEWRGDVSDFIYDNYSYIEELNFNIK